MLSVIGAPMGEHNPRTSARTETPLRDYATVRAGVTRANSAVLPHAEMDHVSGGTAAGSLTRSYAGRLV